MRIPGWVIVTPLNAIVVAALGGGTGTSRGPMSSTPDHRQLIDQYLDRLEQTRHDIFTPEQRVSVHELAGDELFRQQLGNLQEMSPAQQDVFLEGLWRCAMIKSRIASPAPAVLTQEMLDSVTDSDLPQFLWDHILIRLDRIGVIPGACLPSQVLLPSSGVRSSVSGCHFQAGVVEDQEISCRRELAGDGLPARTAVRFPPVGSLRQGLLVTLRMNIDPIVFSRKVASRGILYLGFHLFGGCNMQTLVVDNVTRAKLQNLTEALELRDETGQILGHFFPTEQHTGIADGARSCPYSDGEIEQLRRQTGGRPLAEIWSSLERTS